MVATHPRSVRTALRPVRLGQGPADGSGSHPYQDLRHPVRQGRIPLWDAGAFGI